MIQQYISIQLATQQTQQVSHSAQLKFRLSDKSLGL